MSDREVEHWTGEQRSDGARVSQVLGGFWIAFLADKPPIIACPCCGSPFETARGAKLLANYEWPVGDKADPIMLAYLEMLKRLRQEVSEIDELTRPAEGE